jgi:uncharacterized protein
MVRLVCSPEKNIELDLKGKKPGRGAYLCKLVECYQMGLKGNRLERALRINLTPEDRERLARELKESISDESE